MRRVNLHLFPISVFLLTSGSFLITYLIAVRLNHVDGFLPYISSTGMYPPESCIFTFCATISSFLLAICVYIRHLYVILLCDHFTRIGRTMINCATACGFLACLGLAMVGSFQINNIPVVHYTGASLTFFGGFTYFSFQAFFSYRLKKQLVYLYLLYLRWTLCAACITLLVVAIYGNVVAVKESKGDHDGHWSPQQSGYTWHIISAMGEWLSFYSLNLLTLSFMPEFRTVAVRSPRIYIQGVSQPVHRNEQSNISIPNGHNNSDGQETYVVAVSRNHVDGFLPYISSTGMYPPESCIFSFCATISSFLLAICVYIRHLNVILLSDRFTLLSRITINCVTTSGFLACLGLALVGSFQINNLPLVHYTGAFLTFFGGFIYFSFQAFFTHRLRNKSVHPYLLYLRWSLCALCIAFLVVAIYGNVVSVQESTSDDYDHWSPQQGGYTWHIISALSEWLSFYALNFQILSFLPEFKTVAVWAPRIYIEGVSLVHPIIVRKL